MERRFEVRKQEILKEADIQPQVAKGMMKRLEQFARPFITSFGRREPKENAKMYMSGLLSDLKRKNVESIAYRYDRSREALQKFIGQAPWDHQPLQQELAVQIGTEIGQEDGVIVFDPSGHKKCGNDSVGVQRQWLGRLGKVDVRDGEKGPLATEITKRCVAARTERGRDDCTEELLVVTRTPESNGAMKYDYYLSNTSADTPLNELARVVKAEHRIEDCLKRAKSEAGLWDYEVRTWAGWHHHQTLSLPWAWPSHYCIVVFDCGNASGKKNISRL